MCHNNLSYKSQWQGLQWYGPGTTGKAAIFQPSTNKQREFLATKATQNSRNREQVRDSPTHELIGKEEKKTIMNEGRGLESPFITLKSFRNVWHYSLNWCWGVCSLLHMLLDQRQRCPSSQSYLSFHCNSNPPSLQSSFLTIFWTPVE